MKNIPAFPCVTYFYENGIEQVNERFPGMTMRQWYKGMAPANEIELITEMKRISIYKARGEWADMMLAEDAEQEVKHE